MGGRKDLEPECGAIQALRCGVGRDTWFERDGETINPIWLAEEDGQVREVETNVKISARDRCRIWRRFVDR